MVRLGITRDKEQLTSLIHKADKKNINIVPLPLTKIVPLVTDKSQLPNLMSIDWLFFSSANGVHTFIAQCEKSALLQSLKIAAVGEKTADTVKAYDLQVHFQPTVASGKNLFKEFIDKFENNSLQILYVRAERINFEPATLFSQTQIKYEQLIAYKSEEYVLENSEVETLTESDYLLFTAPSSVTSYKNQFGMPKAKLIAIGNTTNEAIQKFNWNTDIILDKPEIESVLEYI